MRGVSNTLNAREWGLLEILFSNCCYNKPDGCTGCHDIDLCQELHRKLETQTKFYGSIEQSDPKYVDRGNPCVEGHGLVSNIHVRDRWSI